MAKLVKHKESGLYGVMMWVDDDKTILALLENQKHGWYNRNALEIVNSDDIALADSTFCVGFQYWEQSRKGVKNKKIVGIDRCANTTLYEVETVGNPEDFSHVVEKFVWEDSIISSIFQAPASFQIMGKLLQQYKDQICKYEKAISEMQSVFKEMERRYNRFDYDIARKIEEQVGHVKSWVSQKIQAENSAEQMRRHLEEKAREESRSISNNEAGDAHYEARVSRGEIVPRRMLSRRQQYIKDFGGWPMH